MSSRMREALWGGCCVGLVLAACGGPPPKQASGCPDGTVLRDGSCVPPEGGDDHPRPQPVATADTPPDNGGNGGSTVPYDKDATEGELKRAARMVKASCGAAVDETGKNGPFGTTKVQVRLGHNGHVHEVTIPPPFDGRSSGKCAVVAFSNLIFPPFPGQDVVVEWDVEIVQPPATPPPKH